MVKGKHTVKITDQPLTQLVRRIKDKGSKMSYMKSSKVNDNSQKRDAQSQKEK